MSAPHDVFDAAEIFAVPTVDLISMEDARLQLQNHIGVDVIIEGLDQRFTDSITSQCCATSHLFLEQTLARLPATLGDVYSPAIIVCDKTTVRCEKQSSENT